MIETVININESIIDQYGSMEHVVELCGLIPTFAHNAVNMEGPETLMKKMEICYGMRAYPFEHMVLDDNFNILDTSAYDDDDERDPPLPALAMIDYGARGFVAIYHYGIVAVVQDGTADFARFD